MKKKNIAWLLSGAMILTTAAAPVETVSVYAAEEFQADETEVAGTENGDTATETTAEIAVDAAENETEERMKVRKLSLQRQTQKARKKLKVKDPMRMRRLTMPVIWRCLTTVQRN